MKKLIVIILVLIGFSAIAQTPPRTGYLVQTAKWKFVNPVWLDSGAYITKIVKTSGQNRFLVYDSLTGKIGYRFVSTDLSGYVPYTGATTNVNIGANTYIGHSLKSDASDGVLLEAANGTDVGIFGAGNTSNSSLYGGLTIGSLTSGNGTDSVVVASSAGLLKKRPASAFGSTYTGGNGIIVGGSVIYRDSMKSTGQYGNSWQNGMFLGSTNNRSMVWRTNNLQRMTLDTNGRLGIGTSTPSYLFTAIGSGGIGGVQSYIQNTNSGGDARLTLQNNSTGAILTQVTGGGYPIPNIGAFSTSGNLVSMGFITNGDVNSGGTSDIYFNTGGYSSTNERMRIFSTGNITIGSSTSISRFAIPVAPTASANYGLFSISNTTTAFDGSTTGKFVGSATGQYIAVNSVGSVAYNFLQFSKNGASVYRVDSTGKNTFASTITAGGTTGNQTINKPSGTVNIAAAGTTVTVTNSLVSTSSIVVAVVRTNDATAYIKNVVPSSGSFVITLGASATSEVSIGFIVYN